MADHPRVEDAIGREADGERAEQMTDRLDSLDVENERADRPAEEIIRAICCDLGLNPARPPLRPPFAKPPASPKAAWQLS